MADLRVHIAGQGFEVRRIVEPALEMRADRVHLLTEKRGDRAQAYLDEVAAQLKKRGVDVQVHYVPLWDPNAVVGAMGEITAKEQGNHVFVNVSTGAKTCGIGGTIASMLWRLRAYYASVDYDAKLGKSDLKGDYPVKQVTHIPTFSLDPPGPDVLALLDALRARNGQSARKSHIVDGLRKAGHLPGGDGRHRQMTAQAEHGVVDRILKRAAAWDFIDEEGHGRQRRIRINERGEAGLKMFGHLPREPRAD